MDSPRKMLVPALTFVAMLVAAASIGFASVGPAAIGPDCGERFDYYTDASHTTWIGFWEREPDVEPFPCGCTGYNKEGSTSFYYTATNQPYCL